LYFGTNSAFIGTTNSAGATLRVGFGATSGFSHTGAVIEMGTIVHDQSKPNSIHVSAPGNVRIQSNDSNGEVRLIARHPSQPENISVLWDGRDFYPASNNFSSLGTATNAWKTVYAQTGAIQPSDRRLKTDITPFTEAELAVAREVQTILRTYRMTSDGSDGKLRTGLIAQDLVEAFSNHGLDANDYSMFNHSFYTDADGEEQDTMGVRYEEISIFLAAVQHQINSEVNARLAALEAAIARLSNP
jgi:hypothetical protein